MRSVSRPTQSGRRSDGWRGDQASGEPTGSVTGFAIDGISRRGQEALREVVPGYADEMQYRRVVDSLDLAMAFGITTVVEPQNSIDDLALFDRARSEGRLRSRLVVALFHPPGTTSEELDEFERARSRYDDDRLRVAPVKLYIDDVIEPRTAALLDDYSDLPGHRGDTFWEPRAFAELMVELERRGFQTFTHATGDRGIRIALDAIEHARAVHGGRGLRHQIVHVECLAPEDIPRFAHLDVAACMQPRHCAPEIVADWRRHVGPGRWRHAWAFRSLHEAGATLAFSSDWNVAEMDPMVGIYTALTRASLDGREAWITEETLDLETTIRAYTIGGAYANHYEADRGSITRGKYADLVVVSEDLFSLPPSGVLGARVELTVVGGEIAHRTGAFA